MRLALTLAVANYNLGGQVTTGIIVKTFTTSDEVSYEGTIFAQNLDYGNSLEHYLGALKNVINIMVITANRGTPNSSSGIHTLFMLRTIREAHKL